MTEGFPYKRLPGRLRGWVRKASLWEGADHILLVRGTRFQEDYRRFAYRDIESLQTVRAFRCGSYGWLVFTAITCLIPLISALLRNGRPAWIVFAALFGALLIQLGRSLFSGCRCYLQTAVSREELPSLIRRGPAEKTLERLRARIGEAQGTLPEDLSSALDAINGSESPSLSQLAAQPTDNAQAARRSVSLAVAAFVLFLLDAAQSYPTLGGPSLDRHWYSNTYLFAVMVLGMTATITGSLITGFGVRRLKALRVWTLAALGVEVLDLYLSYFLQSLYTVDKGKIISMSMAQVRAWNVSTYGDVILLLAIGLGGLMYVFLKWGDLRRGDA